MIVIVETSYYDSSCLKQPTTPIFMTTFLQLLPFLNLGPILTGMYSSFIHSQCKEKN